VLSNLFKGKIFRRALELYAGPHVADFVDKMDGKVGLGGFDIQITAYFQNLYGFRIDLQKIPPQLSANFLQQYLDMSCEVVLLNKGTLDHLDGEKLKAFWGAPATQKDHLERAAATAVEVVRRFNLMRDQYNHSELSKFQVSIGLNSGRAIVGNFGSKYRFNYTALGETVQLAQRIQTLSPTYGVHVLMTEAAYQKIQDQSVVRDLDILRLPDLETPIRLYELIAFQQKPTESQDRLLTSFSLGVNLFRKRRWDEASDHFFDALKIDKNDTPAKLYVERCTGFKRNPPPPNWNGTVGIKSVTSNPSE